MTGQARATASRSQRRIAIVGYGIAGIAAAIFLRRLGYHVTHFEQAVAPSQAGAGLLLQLSGLAILRQLELLNGAQERGVWIRRIYGETTTGRPVMDLRQDMFGSGHIGLGIQRAALSELLCSADTEFSSLHTGHEIIAVDAQRGYLFSREHGHLGPFDLIIGADGVNSSLRKTLGQHVHRDRPYAWGALVCLLDDPDWHITDCVEQRFAGAAHVSAWPVGTRETGAPHCVSLSWRIPVRTSQARLTGDIDNWKREVGETFPKLRPHLRQITDTSCLVPATYRDVQLRRSYQGRLVLIGDAAHSMSPQLGQGASMALLDAWYLARALQQDENLEIALSAFDNLRRKHVATYRWISRCVTPLFQSDSRVLIAIRDRAFHQLSRVPFVRSSILNTLSGMQYGLFGSLTGRHEYTT